MSRITKSARGEDCQIRIPFVCNFDTSTTVLCHGNGSAAGKGLGMKCPDYIGAYGCSACHFVVDGVVPPPENYTANDIKLMFAEGVFRTQQILFAKGLLRVG